MGTLPRELYQDILEQLRYDTKALYSLSLTCHALYQEATPLLYRKVVLVNERRQYRFLLSITNSQTLANCVRSWAFDPSQFTDDDPELHRLFDRAVRALTNLECLLIMGNLVRPIVQILHTVPLQLRFLRCRSDRGIDAEFLCSWLGSQRNLTELHLVYATSVEVTLPITPATILPPLVRFYGRYQALKFLLPHCPTIRDVHCRWTETFMDQERADKSFLSSLKQVRRLGLERFAYEMFKRLEAIKFLVSLEVLEIEGHREENPIIERYPLERVVSQLPKLRWLVISSFRGALNFYIESKEEVAKTLLLCSSTLQYVSIVTGGGWNSVRRHHAYYHLKRDLTSSSVSFTAPYTLGDWHWGLHDDGYLQEGWDGS